LATDLAARGLDIANVKAVINFEIPYEITRYIHRVGRTARIGSEGVSVTLCLEKEVRDFKKMIR
jgi:ATP-dependent RNA helicase DDX27